MIRTAHLSDLDQILRIEASEFQCDRLSRRAMTYMIKNPRARFIVWVHLKVIAGYAILLEHRRCSSARLYSLAVESSFQGRGIADELMTQLERICSKPSIKLEVRSDNLRAQAFYKRRHFANTGTKLNYYADGNSAIVMKKGLHINGQ